MPEEIQNSETQIQPRTKEQKLKDLQAEFEKQANDYQEKIKESVKDKSFMSTAYLLGQEATVNNILKILRILNEA